MKKNDLVTLIGNKIFVQICSFFLVLILFNQDLSAQTSSTYYTGTYKYNDGTSSGKAAAEISGNTIRLMLWGYPQR